MQKVIVTVVLGLTMAMVCPQLSSAAPEPLIQCGTEPPPTNLLIQYGDIVECAIDVVTDIDVFRFPGTEGHTITLSLIRLSGGGSGTVIAHLFAPSDTLITPIETLASWQTKHIVLPETGTYSIRVSESGNNNTVYYRLALERLFPASPTARSFGNPSNSEFDETLSDTLDPVLDRDMFLFEVKANAPIILALRNLTLGCGSSPCPIAQLFAPDGTLLKRLVASSSTGVFVLTEQGTYTIEVAERGIDQKASYGLSLQCATGDPADCKPPPLDGPFCDGLKATMIGTDADDILFGTSGDDVIVGLDGDDTIYGGNGNDVICGGQGADILFGQAGDDRLLGEEGNNYLNGGVGNDLLFGGSDRDLLFGGSGNDQLFGQEGNDYLSGDNGDDTLQGGTGNKDVCEGGTHINGDNTDGSCETVRSIP